MSSEFDDLFTSFAVPTLIDEFGEKDDAGAYVYVEYSAPGRPPDYPKFQWPAILGPERIEPVFSPETGEMSMRVYRTADVPMEYLTHDEITEFQLDAVFTTKGYDWTMNESESRWDGSFVRFGLERIPLMRGNELRASV